MSGPQSPATPPHVNFAPPGVVKLVQGRSLVQDRSEVESAALQAAVLLRGGLPAGRVWQVMARESPESAILSKIWLMVRSGASVPRALTAVDDPAWRVLAAVWEVADTSGAPLAAALEQFASAMRDLDRIAERRSVLLAGTRSTIRLVIALPPFALVLGAALGFDPISVLVSPIGMVLAFVGVLLLALGMLWAQKLVAAAMQADRVAGWPHELCAIALAGGSTSREAVKTVADCVDAAGAEWVRLSELRRDGSVAAALATAQAIGSAAGLMLKSAAEAARGEMQAELEREAERLAIRVLVPLGVCVLPAFIVLGVVPVIIAVLGGITV